MFEGWTALLHDISKIEYTRDTESIEEEKKESAWQPLFPLVWD